MELAKPGKGNETTVQVILWGVIFFNFCGGGNAHHGRRGFEARGILASEIKQVWDLTGRTKVCHI